MKLPQITLTDVLLFVGTACVVIGVAMLLGTGAAFVAAGVLALALAVFGAAVLP